MKIGIACGGTGGHIFPGLAVAQALRQRGHEVWLYLAGKAGEDLALAGWKGPVVTVPARGISSLDPWTLLLTGVGLLRAVLRCAKSLRRFGPDVLLAMGSYASVGPVLSARWLRIPVVLHEANVIPGRAIRFLSRFAEAVAVSFPETRAHLPHRRLVVTGMPVRGTGGQTTDDGRPIAAIENPAQRGTSWSSELVPGRFTILVMGGSRGARRLNELVSQAILRLHREGHALQVIHLTGLADEHTIRQVYQGGGVPQAVFGFLQDMPRAYQWASLAICRSGASTCAELSVYGVPALLVPYPFAIHRHQTANADALAAAGAADLCDEQLLTVDFLTDYLIGLMRDPARLARMREAARRRVTNIPAAALADLVEQVGSPQ